LANFHEELYRVQTRKTDGLPADSARLVVDAKSSVYYAAIEATTNKTHLTFSAHKKNSWGFVLSYEFRRLKDTKME